MLMVLNQGRTNRVKECPKEAGYLPAPTELLLEVFM
jgi:hypothetical protein